MLMKYWVNAIKRMLHQGDCLMVALVLDQEGSTPRTKGARMILGPDTTIGTIGGGRIEASVLQTAREMLGKPGAVMCSFDLTAEIADGMDMICGGRMDILIESLLPNSELDSFYSQLLEMLNRRQDGFLVTEILATASPLCEIRRWIHGPADLIIGTKTESNYIQSILFSEPRNLPASMVCTDTGSRFLIEAIGPPETVYLFGAGHVSLQTAILSNMLGFETVVLDDRAEFANNDRFPDAQVRVLPSFDRAFEELIIDQKSYIIILTRGHIHDKTVLVQALQTPAKYIGMIGSRKKRDAIYRSLEAAGFSDSDFKRVSCPIGLSINAQTPEEIAVSICAELIQIRHGK